MNTDGTEPRAVVGNFPCPKVTGEQFTGLGLAYPCLSVSIRGSTSAIGLNPGHKGGVSSSRRRPPRRHQTPAARQGQRALPRGRFTGQNRGSWRTVGPPMNRLWRGHSCPLCPWSGSQPRGPRVSPSRPAGSRAKIAAVGGPWNLSPNLLPMAGDLPALPALFSGSSVLKANRPNVCRSLS